MANFTVVYDANVLYPAPLRDFLMRLALTDLFRARWTEDIHEEWIRNLLEVRNDLTREQRYCCKDYFMARRFFKRISLCSNLKQ